MTIFIKNFLCRRSIHFVYVIARRMALLLKTADKSRSELLLTPRTVIRIFPFFPIPTFLQPPILQFHHSRYVRPHAGDSQRMESYSKRKTFGENVGRRDTSSRYCWHSQMCLCVFVQSWLSSRPTSVLVMCTIVLHVVRYEHIIAGI